MIRSFRSQQSYCLGKTAKVVNKAIKTVRTGGPEIEELKQWLIKNGATLNVEINEDSVTGRGLYSLITHKPSSEPPFPVFA